MFAHPFARLVGAAIIATVGSVGSANAAWDNVFQVTCCGTTPRTSNSISHFVPATSFFAPVPTTTFFAPVTPCCPQVQMVQRVVTQPVTTFRPVVVNEPVTTMRQSFFWEPVTTTTFSLSIDPCTGCAHQVATPTTSFRLRSRCDPVTSFVQRVSFQPVVTQVQSSFWEAVPVNPCAAPVAAVPAQPAVVTPPATTPAPPSNPVTTTEQYSVPPSTPAPPLNQSPTTSDPLNRSTPTPTTAADGTRTRTAPPKTVAPPAPRGPIRWEQVASLRKGGTTVTGTVVTADDMTRPAAQLHFVPIDNQDRRIVATADREGKFDVALAAGRWRLYVDDAAGAPSYHSLLNVSGDGTRTVKVVSR